ncbi:hypothetical protein PCLA_09r0028 [Pseudomonas citronellolis]|nr:hypothetical protein PCLA_09r0028 [Pseudomonas citronellolis]
MRLAGEEHPPLRYLAGSDALQVMTGKLVALTREVEQWRDWSALTDGNFS